MKIIIEIASGIVSGVYYQRLTPQGRIPDVVVVDLDALDVGEELAVGPVTVEPLKDATNETKEALGL